MSSPSSARVIAADPPAGRDAISSARLPHTELTSRERNILVLIASGHGNAEIARRLGCSQHTVKNTLYDLMGRLQLRNRVHAAAYAVREGLV